MTEAQLITALLARKPRAGGADEKQWSPCDLDAVKAIQEDRWTADLEERPRLAQRQNGKQK
jgi:hypothetical protein